MIENFALAATNYMKSKIP